MRESVFHLSHPHLIQKPPKNCNLISCYFLRVTPPVRAFNLPKQNQNDLFFHSFSLWCLFVSLLKSGFLSPHQPLKGMGGGCHPWASPVMNFPNWDWTEWAVGNVWRPFHCPLLLSSLFLSSFHFFCEKRERERERERQRERERKNSGKGRVLLVRLELFLPLGHFFRFLSFSNTVWLRRKRLITG